MKIAVIVSHPIQHFCPAYKSWSKIEGVDLKVFFVSPMGAVPYEDKNFNQTVRWNNLYLDEFSHQFIYNKPIPTGKNETAPGLKEAIDEFKPDVLISYGHYHLFQRKIVDHCKRNKIKVAYISDTEIRNKQSNIKRWIKNLYLQLYFKKIDFFLAVGDSNEAHYRLNNVADTKIIRMPFPIDIHSLNEVFANKIDYRKNFRSKWKIDDSALVCIMVGKLVKWKYQSQLLAAAKAMNKEKIVMLFAGSGSEMDALKQYAREHSVKAIFTGFITPEELGHAYAASDLYVHTALFEPHSLAVSEAIYMGLPVIVSDTIGSYGCNDDVRPGINGFVYKWGDLNELERLIKLLCNDQQLRAEFGENSRRIGVYNQNIAHFKGVKTLRRLAQIEK